MAKVLAGVLVSAVDPRLRRGEVTYKRFEFQAEDGRLRTWKDLSMAPEVASVLRPGEPLTLYLSPLFGALFGVRARDGAAAFESDSASPLFLVMAVGMIGLGLGTSMFLLPLLIALAGVVGVCLHVEAVSARRRYRRDDRRLRAQGGAHD